MKIEVLYEDNDILVAVKPYGLPSQPDKKNSENMVSMLKLRIFEKEHRTEEPYLAPIHRLDRQSGWRHYVICQEQGGCFEAVKAE